MKGMTLRRRRVTTHAFAVLVLVALGWGGALLTSCAENASERAREICANDHDRVVDPVLVAYLSRARAAHHQADLAEAKGDHAAAVRALHELASARRPATPEADEVAADTRARLAELRSAAGDFEAALADIEAGLALAKTPTHFRGHLFEVRGVVWERRSAALAAAGDDRGAAEARERAIAEFARAIEVQDEVIERALGTR